MKKAFSYSLSIAIINDLALLYTNELCDVWKLCFTKTAGNLIKEGSYFLLD